MDRSASYQKTGVSKASGRASIKADQNELWPAYKRITTHEHTRNLLRPTNWEHAESKLGTGNEKKRCLFISTRNFSPKKKWLRGERATPTNRQAGHTHKHTHKRTCCAHPSPSHAQHLPVSSTSLIACQPEPLYLALLDLISILQLPHVRRGGRQQSWI